MNLQDAINAAQAARKTLSGADGDVTAETADVKQEQAILDGKVATLKAAVDAETAAKESYKASLGTLIDSANAEISSIG